MDFLKKWGGGEGEKEDWRWRAGDVRGSSYEEDSKNI